MFLYQLHAVHLWMAVSDALIVLVYFQGFPP